MEYSRKEKKRAGSRALAWLMALAMVLSLLPQTGVSAAEDTVTSVKLGSAGMTFTVGTKYVVPISLKKETSLSEASAAAECPGKYGTLTIADDGTATLTMKCRGVTVGTATDYAYNFQIYSGKEVSSDDKSDDVGATAANIVSMQTVETTNGMTTTEKTVPEYISFAIPSAMTGEDGVYMRMKVDAMEGYPNAYLKIDYASAVVSGDASLNYTTEVATAKVEQFGEYNVTAQVTVTDGVITAVDIQGTDFGGTHAEDNEAYLSKAVNGTSSKKGMKDKLVGLYANDDTAINDLDAVSGATYSSNAIKEAVMNALGIVIETETIPEAELPDDVDSLEAGKTYAVPIKDITDVVAHSVIGKDTSVSGKWDAEKQWAYLTVDGEGNLTLAYKFVSGTTAEPLEVLGFNGYYDGYDAATSTAGTLTMDGVKTLTEKDGDFDVITKVEMPLGTADSLQQYYNTNVYLYVDAMKNLGADEPETLAGVTFDKGKFNIDSKITVYWDSLYECGANDNKNNDPNDFLTEEGDYSFLADGTYAITGKLKKPTGETSMADNAITHTMELTVKDGAYTIAMNFKGLTVGTLKGYLQNLKYYKTGYTADKQGNPSGDLADVTVESYQKYTDGTKVSDVLNGTTYTDYPDIVSFPLIAEAVADGRVPLQVFVPIMESIGLANGGAAGSGTQALYLTLDWTSVTAASENDAAFSAEDVVDEKPDSGSDSNNSGGSNNNSSNNGNSSNSNNNNKSNNNSSTGTSTAKVVKGQTYTVGANKYKALSANTVAFAGLKNKKAKKANIPATVTVGGVSCKVVSIAANACKNCKKLKKVTIGANVTAIGAKAFYGCKSLKKITVKSKKLRSVGKKALYGINKKAVIKVPKNKKKKYTKLFKNKGQKKTVKVK